MRHVFYRIHRHSQIFSFCVSNTTTKALLPVYLFFFHDVQEPFSGGEKRPHKKAGTFIPTSLFRMRRVIHPKEPIVNTVVKGPERLSKQRVFGGAVAAEVVLIHRAQIRVKGIFDFFIIFLKKDEFYIM